MPLRWETISLVIPEGILIVAATLVMVGGAFWQSRSAWSLISILALVLAAMSLAWTAGAFQQPTLALVEGSFLVDVLALSGRMFAFLIGGLLLLMQARRSAELQGGELPGLLLILTAGLSMTALAGNLVLLFLALEMTSIPSYVLLFLGRTHRDSTEATVKYFLLSVLSSAMLLMGFALLFAIAGTADLAGMANLQDLSEPAAINLLGLAMGLVLFGLAFKLTAVPGHFYAPDVYQATTNANAGLLSVVPKFAGGIALLRLVGLGIVNPASVGWQVILCISILSMTVGNLAALWQSNLRRMMAYSSIAHAGYLLIGVAVVLGSESPDAPTWFSGLGATFFYLMVYALASIGIFAAFAELSTEHSELSDLRQLNGLFRRRPVLALTLAVCLFSLTGLPPLAGFWGKFELLGGALQNFANSGSTLKANWFLGLGLIALVNAAIAATYYLRVVAATYFQAEPTSRSDGRPDSPSEISSAPWLSEESNSALGWGSSLMAAGLAAGLVLWIGLWPGPFVTRTRAIGESLMVAKHPSPDSRAATSSDSRAIVTGDIR